MRLWECSSKCSSCSECSSGCSSGSSNSRIRDFAVDVIAQAFCQTSKNGLTPDSRSQFLGRLRDLKAVEVAKKVRSRFKMERDCVDMSMDGGYIDYLKACGFKIDPKDKQVIYEMGDGLSVWSHKNDSQEKVNKQIAKVTSRMTRQNKKHNEKEGVGKMKTMCAVCQRKEEKGEKFRRCGRCRIPFYCGKECKLYRILLLLLLLRDV